jgi:hypothetical protein
MSPRIASWTIWSIVVLQVVLIILKALLEVSTGLGSSSGVYFVAQAVVGAIDLLAFPAVGALIFSRRPEHPIGWIFCTANLGWAINNFAGSYTKYTLVVYPGSLPAGELMVWFYTWPGIISVGLYTFLILLFPDGTLLSARWRPVAWAAACFSVVGAVLLAFAPGPVESSIGFEVTNPLGIEGPLGDVLMPLAQIVQPLSLLPFAAAAVSLILRQRRSRGVERQQLKWLTSSIAVLTILTALQLAVYVRYGDLPAEQPGWAQLFVAVSIFSFVLIPVAAGIAILRYRLYELDLLINRTLVYGTLTASLAVVYVGGVISLQYLFRLLTGEESNLAIVASTLIIAALFNPLRRRIQALVDRRFYRRKYDAAKTLEAFSARLRDETDLQRISDDLVGVVRETMQPTYISLWLRPVSRAISGVDPASKTSSAREVSGNAGIERTIGS